MQIAQSFIWRSLATLVVAVVFVFLYETTIRDSRYAARQATIGEATSIPQAGAQLAYTTWPAYRVSQGELRTFQWRLNDCFRQQRFPELEFGSPASIALTTFLAYNANGAAFAAPAIKR